MLINKHDYWAFLFVWEDCNIITSSIYRAVYNMGIITITGFRNKNGYQETVEKTCKLNIPIILYVNWDFKKYHKFIEEIVQENNKQHEIIVILGSKKKPKVHFENKWVLRLGDEREIDTVKFNEIIQEITNEVRNRSI